MAARGRFVKDAGLNFRMGVALFLNGLIYVIFILAIWAIWGQNATSIAIAVVVSIAVFFFQWYFSDKLAMASIGAREVTPEQAPELHTIVDRLTQLADTTKPRVAYSDSPAPNAFATGRSPNHSVVCVTRGLLETLEPREVEAVLAHELSHVAHRDVTVMTVAGVTGVLAGFMVRAALYVRPGYSRSNNNNGNAAAAIQLLSIVVGAVVYALSFVLIRVLSRYRELAADRAAAHLTGAPTVLASALVKISGEMGRVPQKDLRAQSSANHLAIIPAANGKSVVQLFSTHPPLEKRLEQLNRIARELSQPH